MHLALSSKVVFMKQLLPHVGHSSMESQAWKAPTQVISFILTLFPAMRLHCHYALIDEFTHFPFGFRLEKILWQPDSGVRGFINSFNTHFVSTYSEPRRCVQRCIRYNPCLQSSLSSSWGGLYLGSCNKMIEGSPVG